MSMQMQKVKISELNPNLIKGVNFDKADAVLSAKDGFVPLLRAHNIKNMRVNFDELMFIKSSVVKDEQYLRRGDVVFVTSSGSKHLVGKSALILDLSQPTTIGAFNSILRFPDNIEPRYVFYSLNSSLFKLHIANRLAGANIQNIKKNDILDFELVLPFKDGSPDLAEQKRIADKLDGVFSNIESGLTELYSQRTQANELKQSLLVSIFSNQEWQTQKLSDVADINPRKNVGKLEATDEVSFIPMESVDDLTGQILSKQTRDLGTVARGYTAFQNGDVIFAKITPCMENGKCAVADGLENGVGFGSTEFYVVRPKENISPDYLWHFLRQERVRAEAKKHFTGAAGHKRVPKTFVENLELPIPLKKGKPDFAQQQKVVAELDKKFEVVDELLALLAKQEQTLLSLRLSLLKAMLKSSTDDESVPNPLRFNISPRMFDIQQAVAQIIKRFQRGEMVVAKILYIGQAVYGVPTNIQFTPQHFGPYDSIVKKAVMTGLSSNNKFFARRGTGHAQVLTLGENGKTILRYSTSELAHKVNLYLDEMMPYFYQCDSAAIERLATVCKIIEDEKTVDDAVVKARLQQWKPNKFAHQDVSRTLAFIKKREWDKRLIKR